MSKLMRVFFMSILLPAFGLSGYANGSESIDLDSFSLEELLDVEVVSVSKKPEVAFKAAAAVSVITADDIRRCRALSIPEILRLVPGVHVAQIDALRWAITARGFNSRFANKLQVLIDGRSIYSPMFSGTYWEAGEISVEDIERIEVIRGPGATLWGANAVNGVINIITHDPDGDDRTRAGVAVGTGGLRRTHASLSTGTGRNSALRVSATNSRLDNTSTEPGLDASDKYLLNARWDMDLGEHDHLHLSGRFLNLDEMVPYAAFVPQPPYIASGIDDMYTRISGLEAEWRRKLSDTANLEIHASHTWFRRIEYLIEDRHEVNDLHLQHNFALGDRNTVVWGIGGRRYHDNMTGRLGYGFDPDTQTDWTVQGFVQDEIKIVPDQLRLTLGLKIEGRNDVDPLWQPNGRFAWTPAERHTVWGSVARAGRTPSRSERHIHIDIAALPPGATPMNPANVAMLSLVGNDDIQAESMLAYELGYRQQPTKHLSFDLAVFINEYDNLLITENGALRTHPIYGPTVLQMPLIRTNGDGAHTMGGELATTLSTDTARLQLTYSYIEEEKHSEEESIGSPDLGSPKHRYTAHFTLTPGSGLEFDLLYRHLAAFEVDEVVIPDQDEIDIRLGWRPDEVWSMSIGWCNLLHESHVEFYDSSNGGLLRPIDRTFVATVKRWF